MIGRSARPPPDAAAILKGALVSGAMILLVVAHTTIKAPKQPCFPALRWLTVRHGGSRSARRSAGAWPQPSNADRVRPGCGPRTTILGVSCGKGGGMVGGMAARGSCGVRGRDTPH